MKEAEKSMLIWQEHLVVLNTQPEAKHVRGSFHYRNIGDRPIRIHRIINACGCTNATVEHSLIASGEAGELKVDFTIGSMRGEQYKVVEVFTDDGEYHRLGLKINIDTLATLSQSVLTWERGEARTSKSTVLSITRPEPLHIEGIDSPDTNFTANLNVLKEGRLYRLDIIPPEFLHDLSVIFHFKTTEVLQAKEQEKLHVHARLL